jgi:hypothetical protein
MWRRIFMFGFGSGINWKVRRVSFVLCYHNIIDSYCCCCCFLFHFLFKIHVVILKELVMYKFCCLLGVLFDCKNIGSTFLWNFGKLADYMHHISEESTLILLECLEEFLVPCWHLISHHHQWLRFCDNSFSVFVVVIFQIVCGLLGCDIM